MATMARGWGLFLLALWMVGELMMGMAQAPPPDPIATVHHLPEALDDLYSCRFNAYSPREDLIIGAIVFNWDTGAGCTQNIQTRFPVASVGKLFIAEWLYREVLAERLSFEQELTFTANYLMNGQSACLDASQVGESFTLGYLGNIMISCSDNAATWMLMDLLGWEAVNTFVQEMGIADLGEIIPYSRVDQLKLRYLDPRWEDVPLHLASQFYRRQSDLEADLVPRYFPSLPSYTPEQIRAANAHYLQTYDYNTATPYALAQYMQRLRDNFQSDDDVTRTAARWVINTMILTQRVFSTQNFPGTVYVGSKNGFDLGYRAEVNVTLNDLESLLPNTLSIIIVRHRDVTAPDIVPYQFRGVPVTDLLLTLSPKIAGILFPNNNSNQAPTLQNDFRVRKSVANTDVALYPCYQNFLDYDFLDGLQRCWATITSIDRLAADGPLYGFGAIVRDMNQSDARFTVIYYPPNGRQVRAYQMARFNVDGSAMAWFEDVSIPGVWRMDVFFNLQPILSQTFYVE